MYYLISVKHLRSMNVVITQILDHALANKIQVIYKILSGKIFVAASGPVLNLNEYPDIAIVKKLESMTTIQKMIANLHGTFAVRANVSNSSKMNSFYGSEFLKLNPDLKVNLKDPDFIVHMEKIEDSWFGYISKKGMKNTN